MINANGLPPVLTNLPGQPIDRPPSAAAVQARQAEAANGRTPGTRVETLAPNAVTGLAGLDKSSRLQSRRLPDPPPDPDAPAGPPPAFTHTPLEKLRYPPSPLEALARRVREMKDEGEVTRQGSDPPGQDDSLLSTAVPDRPEPVPMPAVPALGMTTTSDSPFASDSETPTDTGLNITR